MRRVDVLLFLIFMSFTLFAQSKRIFDRRASKNIDYLLHVGDTIRFFPSNPDYAGSFSQDYTCFYDIICLEKGIKPKYRFAANKQNFTPKTEIENAYFYVKELCSVEFVTKNKLAYSAVLERLSDHVQILFAFPQDLTKDISIINSWVVKGESLGYHQAINSLVIPYLPKWFIDEMNRLKGKTLLLKKYYDRDLEDYQMLQAANGESKANRLSSILSKIREGDSFIVGKMNFISLGGDLTYQQPFLSITDPRDDYMYRIPVCHFAGNSNKLYIIRGEIENLPKRHFVEKESYIASLKEKEPRLDSLIGNTYYFDTNNYDYKDVRGNIRSRIRPVDSLDDYYTLNDGYYKCVGFDCFPDQYSKSFFSYCAIFEDNTGKRFTFPVSIENRSFGRNDNMSFTKLFMPKTEKEERDRRKAQDDKELERLETKYGVEVGSSIFFGLCTEDRYASLCKKYGKKKAGLMASRKYEVGWTYTEFNEVRRPYEKFECIHSNKNKFGTIEVYKYGSTPTYIMFQNGRIESISNFYDSDF